MRAGRRAPGRGWLPVFSVGSEKEAESLLALCCSKNYTGDFVAFELAQQQTIENLARFGRRLAEWHDRYIVPHGRCECQDHKRTRSTSER